MAILQFPRAQLWGKLIWEKGEKKLNTTQIENAGYILYYMGYNINEDIDSNEIAFGMRGVGGANASDFRNILFDFTLIFSMFNIRLRDLEYAKIFLKELYIPLDEESTVEKNKFIVENETLFLVHTDNYMVNGNGSNISQPELYFNQYYDGKEILPLMAKDKIEDIILKIKLDVAQGAPRNDPYANSFFLT